MKSGEDYFMRDNLNPNLSWLGIAAQILERQGKLIDLSPAETKASAEAAAPRDWRRSYLLGLALEKSADPR
jgi:hypothetical protein